MRVDVNSLLQPQRKRAATRGSFKPGQCGNPAGRKKLPLDVVELARSHTLAAMQTLVEINGDKHAPPAARVKAAETIINRGYGTAPQVVRHEGDIVHHVKRVIIEDVSAN